MKCIQYLYNDEIIDFSTNGNNNLMVNATQIAKIFDKRIDYFLKSDQTKLFIKELQNHLDNNFIQPPNGGRINSKVVEYRGRNGVFFERRLALKFAAWLDVKFELWIFTAIDQIILGEYKEHKEATVEKLKAVNDLEKKKTELLEKYPEFIDFLSLEGKITEAEKRRMKAMRLSVQQLKLDLFPEN